MFRLNSYIIRMKCDINIINFANRFSVTIFKNQYWFLELLILYNNLCIYGEDNNIHSALQFTLSRLL